MINVFQPDTGDEEAQAVKDVLASRWLGKGKLTANLEAFWAEHIGARDSQVVSTNSATEGLFQIMRMLSDRGVRDVVMPSINFIGAGNAAKSAGIKINYCDVDRRTLNARAEDIDKAMPATRPVAVVLLHYGGLPCEMTDILGVCDRPSMYLVEDAACAPSSTYHGFACGTFGHFAVWSFDAMKIITMGDGGMVYCNTPEAADGLRDRLYLGMDSASGLSGADNRWWQFASDGDGRRSITNDIAAAIGLAQLVKLARFVARRRQIHRMYNERLAAEDWIILPPDAPDGVESSHYLYWIQIDDRDDLSRYLRNKGIYTTFRYWPLHRAYGVKADCPNTERAAEHTLNLPLHTGLTDANVDTICNRVIEFGRQRTEGRFH